MLPLACLLKSKKIIICYVDDFVFFAKKETIFEEIKGKSDNKFRLKA